MHDLTLSLKHDEALVLFDWLVSLSERAESRLRDDAEQTILWKIEGQLESVLPEIVQDDYKQRVAAAKARICPVDRTPLAE